MKKFVYFSVVFSMILAMGYGTALAASSGNFAADIGTAACTINGTTGALGGGLGGTVLETTIRTPNASSTALIMRPSFVTGLFTKTRIDTTVSEFTAIAGIKVRVLLDNKVVAPGTPVGNDVTIAGNEQDGWVYYDKRFQQLKSGLFGEIEECAENNPDCYIELILSTLGAHSLDFVAGDVGGGDHTVKVEWMFEIPVADGNSAACVGPGVFTVQQVKTFSTGGGIDID